MFFYVCLILTVLTDQIQIQLPIGFNYKWVHRETVCVFFLAALGA